LRSFVQKAAGTSESAVEILTHVVHVILSDVTESNKISNAEIVNSALLMLRDLKQINIETQKTVSKITYKLTTTSLR
jgi:predicted RNA-binding protein with PIN domain